MTEAASAGVKNCSDMNTGKRVHRRDGANLDKGAAGRTGLAGR